MTQKPTLKREQLEKLKNGFRTGTMGELVAGDEAPLMLTALDMALAYLDMVPRIEAWRDARQVIFDNPVDTTGGAMWGTLAQAENALMDAARALPTPEGE